MKRLVSTSFRRRVLAFSLVSGIFFVLCAGILFYHIERAKLVKGYSVELTSHLPSVINELNTSKQLPPIEKWPEVYGTDSEEFAMVICDDNDNELWRSMTEPRRLEMRKKGIYIPHIDNYCTDPLLSKQKNTVELIQTLRGSAFITHVIALEATEYNPSGRIIVFRRMNHKIDSLHELKMQVTIATVLASLLISLLIHTIYRWGFRPLQTLEHELKLVRAGKSDRLEAVYPEDLAPLTNALNEMLFQQKENEQRYRRALNDLAHSLKTRVAVSQALLSDIEQGKIDAINQQLLEMDDVIQGQLKRASYGVKGITENSTLIKPILNSLTMMFDKVYIDKKLQVEMFISNGQTLPMSKSDIMEIFGNVLENTYRFAESRIDIFVNNGEEGLVITINNDGPPIEPSIRESLFQRGVRADQQNPGTGLGLALCDEIIHSYKGAIWFEDPADPSMGVSLKMMLPYRSS
ncbi:GHKL domain-containing protein [Vibrio aquaticus]|uniref:histidine kinase n=1 Tax=Vibrio aquaticus TaxID=2496559 RepID=A0A3S0MM16_9VIBR|nr:ATP-binding protein [Vibrio aquaticus]RTZ14468.1 GHKL domain-containing protein [Vibrio aquaticus]